MRVGFVVSEKLSSLGSTNKFESELTMTSVRKATALEELLVQADPLLKAFENGQVKANKLKDLASKLGLTGSFEHLMESNRDTDMGNKVRELLTEWFNEKGKFECTVDALCQFLRDIRLGGVAVDIETTEEPMSSPVAGSSQSGPIRKPSSASTFQFTEFPGLGPF